MATHNELQNVTYVSMLLLLLVFHFAWDFFVYCVIRFWFVLFDSSTLVFELNRTHHTIPSPIHMAWWCWCCCCCYWSRHYRRRCCRCCCCFCCCCYLSSFVRVHCTLNENWFVHFCCVFYYHLCLCFAGWTNFLCWIHCLCLAHGFSSSTEWKFFSWDRSLEWTRRIRTLSEVRLVW